MINYKRFIERYFRIKNKEGEIVPFILNPTQAFYYEQLTKDYPKGLIGIRENILKARREGFSSFWEAIFTVDFIMGSNGLAPIAGGQVTSHKIEETKPHFQRISLFLDSYLDKKKIERKDYLDVDNKTSYMKSMTGCELFIGSAGAKVLGRGGDLLNLLFTEVGFYPNTPIINAEDLITGAEQQVPMGLGKIVRESTGNVVGDFFYEEWHRGNDGESDFKSRFFPWFVHKEYRVPCPPAFKFPANDLEVRRDYSLDSDQLYWYYLKGRSFKDSNRFRREYPNCVVADTRVSTHSSTFRIGDHKKYYKGRNGVFRLTTSLGYSVETTADHKFFTEDNGWIVLKNLIKGDRIRLLEPIFNSEYQRIKIDLGLPILKQELKIDEELAEFIGIFMGDGSVHKNKKGSFYTLSIVFNKKDQSSIKQVKRKMEKMFGKSIGRRTVGSRGGGLELRVGSKYFRELFNSLELIRKSSNGIKRKVHVPSYILSSPKSVVAAFLRGLFDADGFIAYGYPKVMFFSKYEQFIKDVQFLLLGFGITSRLVMKEKKAGDGHLYTGRELVLRTAETEKFMKEIGFISKRKNDRWKNRRVTKENTWNKLKIELVDTIASIESKGMAKVYDMEVQPEHYYSGNGLWIHNSNIEAFLSGGSCFFDLSTLRWYLDRVKEPLETGLLAPDGQFL